MQTTSKNECALLMEVAALHGVKTVVCSPGSRNAPLLIAAEASELDTKVIVDERIAAFYALGTAVATRRSVMLVCTSGTALLNYAPAVAEAFYQGIPLIVVSADRPKEWIDQDDSQTIRQYEALRNFVKNSYDIPADGISRDEMTSLWYANRTFNDAFLTALSPLSGPVHINMRLAPPLTRYSDALPEIKKYAEKRFISASTIERKIEPAEMAMLAEIASKSKIMIVAGFMQPSQRLSRAVKELEALPNVTVMAEHIANLHISEESRIIDTAIAPMKMETNGIPEELKPDLIISLGGALVSRMIKQFLRACKGAETWNVGFRRTTVDCFQSLSRVIECDPAGFLLRLASLLRKNGIAKEKCGFRQEWSKFRTQALKTHTEFVRNAPWSDMKAFEAIASEITSATNVCLSNGTSIRYMQLLPSDAHAYYCNRGVSGIDGCTSTALGLAEGYSGQTLFVTGDMSMAYDIGALGSGVLSPKLKIIVINNGGGGIFRFIQSSRNLPEDTLEKYFCAAPQLPVEQLAKAYGIHYLKADDAEECRQNLKVLLDREGPAILEIRTPAKESAEVLIKYMEL